MAESAHVELPAIELLKCLGYRYIPGKELTPGTSPPERDSFREPVLKYRLSKKLKELNPWLTPENLSSVVSRLTTSQLMSTSLNQEFWRILTQKSGSGGLVVNQDLGDGRGARNQHVKVIEWDPDRINQNEFLVTNQFQVDYQPGKGCELDMVVFINGLPLVVIECKRPGSRCMESAISDLRYYQDHVPRLFHFNQLLITLAGQSARYGVIENHYRHFMEWKDPYPLSIDQLTEIVNKSRPATPRPTPQDILLYGLLQRENFLRLIQYFVVFEVVNGALTKKIPRYHQFRAACKTVDRILTETGYQRHGTIWHTTGSGKSLTMLFSAIRLRSEEALENPLILVINDRIDLDSQLAGTFAACSFPNVETPQNCTQLQQLLSNGEGKTIFTTIQKFRLTEDEAEEDSTSADDEYPVLYEGTNAIVLVDEAHRSQYKKFAARLRKALPNAAFIAFTGTPLARTEHNELVSVGKGRTVR
jgi:type I restriction enzyme R subunit